MCFWTWVLLFSCFYLVGMLFLQWILLSSFWFFFWVRFFVANSWVLLLLLSLLFHICLVLGFFFFLSFVTLSHGLKCHMKRSGLTLCIYLDFFFFLLFFWWNFFFSWIFVGANWCVCKDGLSDAVLQKTLDYACGAGADCGPIHQNGGCYNPNTVRAHCSYAVNSYFQKKGQAQGTCDFAGTASVATSDPSKPSQAIPLPLTFFVVIILEN